MAFDLSADLAEIMLSDEGGIEVTIGGTGYQGIFVEEAIDQGGTDSTEKVVYVRALDLVTESVAHGTAITIGGVAYVVKGIEPDQSGLSRVKLIDP